MTDLPILTQRRIEAAFAKRVYAEMKAELGEAAAKRILSNAIVKLAKATAAEMAAAVPGGASLDSFRAPARLPGRRRMRCARRC